jgi:isoquinoline 1-oxidoreductase subunit alpha
VPQCGYCQPGMIMATAAMLSTIPDPTEQDIAANITNLCRCGTYPRIKTAIAKAAAYTRAISPSKANPANGQPELPPLTRDAPAQP